MMILDALHCGTSADLAFLGAIPHTNMNRIIALAILGMWS